jgi:anti-anti-sigma factor
MFERDTQGTIDVIRGDDALVSEHLERLSNLLEECLDKGPPRAVLDMRDASLIDSAGLELLLDAQTDFQRRGGALKLAAPSPLCKEILALCGVAEHLEIYSDAKTAVGSFAR